MKISIITINYNNKSGLQKTIESVINQTYKDIEYIVVDGNSTDGSKDVLVQYKEHFSYWVTEPDTGIYNAMNKGAAHATGDYLLFLNSGDFLSNYTVLGEVAKHLGDTDLVMGSLRYVPSGNVAYTSISQHLSLLDFVKGSPIPHPSTFIRRDLLERHRYDEDLRIVSDWKFFLQNIILDRCSYKSIDLCVTNFLEEGVSSNRDKCIAERDSVLEALIPDNIRIDYMRFIHGTGYEETAYDKFFCQLKKYKYSHFIYTICVGLTRVLSVVKKSASFARDFPLFLNA